MPFSKLKEPQSLIYHQLYFVPWSVKMIKVLSSHRNHMSWFCFRSVLLLPSAASFVVLFVQPWLFAFYSPNHKTYIYMSAKDIFVYDLLKVLPRHVSCTVHILAASLLLLFPFCLCSCGISFNCYFTVSGNVSNGFYNKRMQTCPSGFQVPVKGVICVCTRSGSSKCS